MAKPTAGPARVFGRTGLGCIAGAVALPPDGPGWQAVRLSRNRNWGHPMLVGTLRDLAARAKAQGFPALWIGDLGQPRGGPMPYGHSSHQVGLDADVWLELSPKPSLTVAAREEVVVPSLVLPDESDVAPARWTPRHAALIRLAAELPGVDRIFVHHAIKRQLCRTDAGAAWLRHVRPWRGHDSHMHIRLRCPTDQPDCHDQPPPPAGDGCDSSLDWWLTAEARHPAQRAPGPPPPLPVACRTVLEAR
ncbi:penicillin-insensitive murein endopeptidase [Dankookia rubra]|uniref:penicillin-insensitive murein endopeptidase n=1 Tax=Dankookia rubra TaxID=1442381 RepID=UPI001F501BA6|nr:penicillin-insensitive murein endopeptidase [Dankookia rubra]